jgi:hypothetical protein
LAPYVVSAALTLQTQRSQVSDSDVITWGSLGASGTFVSQPFQVTSTSGFGLTVWKNNSNGPYQRLDQGSGFNGDFATGDQLLYTIDQAATDILFDAPVEAVGTQIQKQGPTSFTAYLVVYSGEEQIGSFTVPMVVQGTGDGSAGFIGVRSDSRNITRVLFDSFFGGNTAINRLSIDVPETAGIPPRLCRRLCRGEVLAHAPEVAERRLD